MNQKSNNTTINNYHKKSNLIKYPKIKKSYA